MDQLNNSKQHEWELKLSGMRTNFENRMKNYIPLDSHENQLYHGLDLTSATNLLQEYTDICYYSPKQEYLVLEVATAVHRYTMQGKLIQPAYQLGSTMSFTKLLWCENTKAVIGFIPHDDLIWIMSTEFLLYQSIRNDFRVQNLFYEPSSSELIVVGETKVTRYPLHNKEQMLNPWKTLSYMDIDYGPAWKIEYSSLIPENTTLLRLAGSYTTTLYVMPLELGKNMSEGIQAAFIAKRTNVTKAAITALYYHNTSAWIIVADQQGNVSGWDLDLNCIMSSSTDGNIQINMIVPHPSICGFLTVDDNNALQVWSCNFRDKMENFTDLGTIWSIATNETAAAIATLGSKLCCFNMHQLYNFYAPLSGSVTNILVTFNPAYGTKVITTSSDNSVRILSSKTGKQLSTQLLSSKLNVKDVAYSGNTNKMYTMVLQTGEILVSDATTNPMNFRCVWINDETIVTCVVAYEEYIPLREQSLREPKLQHPVKTCIIFGTEDGCLGVIDQTTGRSQCIYQAHIGSITILKFSIGSHYLVSTAHDNCIKIWRVCPDITLPLALIFTLYNITSITHIALIGIVICFSNSSDTNDEHSLFMYNVIDKVQLEHPKSKDHSKVIGSIASLESLEICATSSKDKTIRIWDRQNTLVRILKINAWAHKIGFSSVCGDIIFGAGKHLYRVFFKNYLPYRYKLKIIEDESFNSGEDDYIEENVNYKIYENEIDREIMLHPVSSAPLGSLDPTKTDVIGLDRIMQEYMCAQYKYRDKDIQAIKNGLTKTPRLVLNKSLMDYDSWEKYIHDIIESTKTLPTKIAPHDIWSVAEKGAQIKRSKNIPEIFRMKYGYSMDKLSESDVFSTEIMKNLKASIFGFQSNSLIHKKLDEQSVSLSESTSVAKPRVKYIYPLEFYKVAETKIKHLNEIDLNFLEMIETQGSEEAKE